MIANSTAIELLQQSRRPDSGVPDHRIHTLGHETAPSRTDPSGRRFRLRSLSEVLACSVIQSQVSSAAPAVWSISGHSSSPAALAPVLGPDLERLCQPGALAPDFNGFPVPNFQLAITEAAKFSAPHTPSPPDGRTRAHGGSGRGRWFPARRSVAHLSSCRIRAVK